MLMIKRPGFLFRSSLLVISLSVSQPWVMAEDSVTPPVEEDTAQFDILEFRVEGSSRMDHRTLEKTVYPFLGPDRSLADVEQARTALEKLYHAAGYSAATVDIPEQDVEGGVVFLSINEGTVDRLKVTGSRYFLPSRIRDKVPALAEGAVLNTAEVQTQLAQVGGESPDRSITPVMRAGRTPGTVEVDLQVDDSLPLHGGVEINARNSINTERLRAVGTLRYDNLWQRFHSVSLQYQTAPENYDNLEVWAGTYVMPIEAIDSRLVFYGIGLQSTSSSVASTGSMNVVGTGDIYGLRLVKPLPAPDRFMHSLTVGWDYKDFGQSVGLLGSDTQNAPISYSPFYAAYSGGYQFADGSLSQFNLEANFSIRGLGNSQREFWDSINGTGKREGSRSDYLYVAGDLKHKQVLPRDMRLMARLSGQVADSPLISNEQFSVGGWQTVRGYHETEALGDDGVMASLEWHSPDLAFLELSGMNQLRFLTFFDVARTWVQSPAPGTPRLYDLSSFGVGFRSQWLKHIVGELDWEYPMSSTQYIDAGDQRLDFRVGYEF
jgi:hemolysin activation/secretion protein